MKIAFLFGPLLHAKRGLHFDRLWTDPRGLTGSEVACVAFAQEMALRGHIVTFFCPQDEQGEFGTSLVVRGFAGMTPKVQTDHLDHFARRAGEFDVVCSWCEPDLLRVADPRSVRLVNQQLNDFAYCKPGYDDAVDVWTSPSKTHLDYLMSLGGSDSKKWRVLANGCYPGEYSGEKVRGRCVYVSSPDRGLHLVMQEWPNIRRSVPGATLKIFYFALQRWMENARPRKDDPPNIDVRVLEHRKRARYVENALDRMSPGWREGKGDSSRFGMEVVGGVSRKQLAEELSAAEVMTYPCSTLAWTEGFSCATLEGCASGALPVISGVDALGEIYGGAVPMIPAISDNYVREWRDYVVEALTNKPWADGWRKKARALAEEHAWPLLAERLEGIIEEAAERKRAPVIVPGPGSRNEIVLHMTLTAAAALPAKVLEVEHPERDEHGGGARAGFLGLAKAMAKRPGYRVVAYCPVPAYLDCDGVKWLPISEYRKDDRRPDVLLSYFDFSTLVERTGMLRVASHHSCSPYPGDPYDWADLNVAPSQWAVDYLKAKAPEEKWAVLPNALAPISVERKPVPGRVIHHAPSSRGLHLLLEWWPEIRRRVPEATLHVVGPLDEWMSGHYGRHELRTSSQGKRVARIRAALPAATAAGGLELLGQVSRTRLLQELSEASCFAYPCSMVHPSETWSITVHECLAMGIPTVLIPQDALGGLWGEGCILSNESDFVEHVEVALKHPEIVQVPVERGKTIAARHTFDRAAEVLDGLIRENVK